MRHPRSTGAATERPARGRIPRPFSGEGPQRAGSARAGLSDRVSGCPSVCRVRRREPTAPNPVGRTRRPCLHRSRHRGTDTRTRTHTPSLPPLLNKALSHLVLHLGGGEPRRFPALVGPHQHWRARAPSEGSAGGEGVGSGAQSGSCPAAPSCDAAALARLCARRPPAAAPSRARFASPPLIGQAGRCSAHFSASGNPRRARDAVV